MKHPNQIVISASRRTDIPAFYMNWFMAQIKKGWFEVVNPYNRHAFIVPATPDQVHTIVFWSKNFAPFLEGRFGQTLLAMGYHLFFNFTINSDTPLLEPRVPSLNQRLGQIRDLCRIFDPRSINWRFDPICFFEFEQNGIQNNLHDFSRIATSVSRCGVSRCITSFMDHYTKVKKRTLSKPGFFLVDPSLPEKTELLLRLEEALSEKNVDLYACCEKAVLDALPSGSNIKKSSCIPNDLLVEIFGGDLSVKKDSGQRVKDGCGCMVSVDIGSYHLHPCYHNCLYCYANPSPKPITKTRNSKYFFSCF